MKLSINNIGKLKNAKVEIKGITVIAGENDTGKSTVGKILFSVFNSFYKLDEKIIKLKKTNIQNYLQRLITTNPFEDYPDFSKLIEKIFKDSSIYDKNDLKLRNDILYFIAENKTKSEVDEINETNDDYFENQIKKIQEILKISEEAFINFILTKNIGNEFSNQINNIYLKSTGEIELKIRNKRVTIAVENDDVKSLGSKFYLDTEAIYMDDPFILDELNSNKKNRNNENDVILANHKEHLQNKLIDKNPNIIEEIILNSKLEKFLKKLNETFKGSIRADKNGYFVYKREGQPKELNIKNLSAGLKSFGILKMLSQNNLLEENGTIILDEPEIHLHPEWQIKFAELIVLLQKEFGMHILLTTHSPYFLKAIQVYSKKYEISDKCKYYMSELDGEQAILVDKTSKTDDLFYKLAISFENLMNEEELYED
mgnify:FL=1